jgi:hypothetical protein
VIAVIPSSALSGTYANADATAKRFDSRSATPGEWLALTMEGKIEHGVFYQNEDGTSAETVRYD